MRELNLEAKFFVVEFTEPPKSIAVVHRSWIVFRKKNGTQCWWPSEAAPVLVVTTRHLPTDRNGWCKHDCVLKLDGSKCFFR